MKKRISAIVFGSVVGISMVSSAFAGGWHPQQLDPATCAYYQAQYYQQTGQNVTCQQLAQMWYNGTFRP